MSGELEAAGALATAGLAAGAIEGREGKEGGEGGCANCGAALQGAYCHACGQSAHPHRSLLHVFEEFLHGILHFDTKAWRTLPMVIFRPGTLTRNYVYGKRARYISPLALFLFTVFFMFAIFAFAGTANIPGVNMTEEASLATAQENVAEARAAVREREGELAAAIANPDPNQPAGLEENLARMQVDLAEEELARREATLARVQRVLTETGAQSSAEGVAAAPAAGGVAAPETPGESVVAAGEDGPVVRTNISGESTWQEQLARAAQDEDFFRIDGMPDLSKKIREKFQNPDLLLYKIQQAAYKFSFLLIPISLPFIALLFLRKRGVTFYDHVVFSLYALSFVSLLFVLILQATRWTWTEWAIPWLIFAAIPVHTFFHLKGAYALGWWSALWRTLFMLIFSIVALMIFLVAIFALGVLG